MPRLPGVATVFVALVLTLSACADTTRQTATSPTTAPQAPTAAPPTAAPTAIPQPSAIPQPTAIPPLANDILVAGVDVGGMTPDAARKKLDDTFAGQLRPFDVQLGDEHLTLRPEDIDYEVRLDEMIAQARSAQPGARVPLAVRYDEAKLRMALEGLAKQGGQPPTFSVITSTKTISRSFALSGGARLDVDAAVKQITSRLRAPGGAWRVTLALSPAASGTRPAPAQLQEQIEQMAAGWKGVVGAYVYDLASDQVVAHLHENTVFSGASVMKTPILLWSYINLPSFTNKQEQWLKKMIVDSDNLAANNMLSASAGGGGTDEALQSVLAMSDMLKGLGLQHTYQYMPYEARDYLVNVRKIKIKRGPKQEGPAPYTDADTVLRTTPAEMSRIFLLIYQCSQGKGELLEKFDTSLTPARCQEMLARLEQNGDHTRMVAGLPAGTRVAHKSGWIEDMQADVGIVHSPGGDFLLAIYLYRDITPGKTYLEDRVATPVIASFARLIYSYYNPISIAR